MTQIATVQSRRGKYALGALPQAGCGGSCAGCHGCGSAQTALAEDPIGAQPGQRVILERITPKPSAHRFLLPLGLFLAGFLLASALAAGVLLRYAAGGAFALGGALVLAAAARRRRIEYRIVRLFSPRIP